MWICHSHSGSAEDRWERQRGVRGFSNEKSSISPVWKCYCCRWQNCFQQGLGYFLQCVTNWLWCNISLCHRCSLAALPVTVGATLCEISKRSRYERSLSCATNTDRAFLLWFSGRDGRGFTENKRRKKHKWFESYVTVETRTLGTYPKLPRVAGSLSLGFNEHQIKLSFFQCICLLL